MSGTVALSPESRWSAAGWLFDWTVQFTAEHAADPDVAADLRKVVEENLGWVEVAGLPPPARRVIVESLRENLEQAAEGQLPVSIPEREKVLEHVRQLASLARGLAGM